MGKFSIIRFIKYGGAYRSVCILTFCVVVCFMIYFFISRLNTKNGWAIGLFCGYVANIIIFSVFYYYIYKRNKDAFVFSKSIVSLEKNKFKSGYAKKERILILQKDMLTQVINSLKGGSPCVAKKSSLFNETVSVYIDGCAATVLEIVAMANGVGAMIYSTLSIYNREKEHIGMIEFPGCMFGHDVQSLIECHEEAFLQVEEKYIELLVRKETINSCSPYVWYYFDFFYFSTICQTTVGFGDIVPGNALVRTLVALQILVGYLLISVSINIVFPLY